MSEEESQSQSPSLCGGDSGIKKPVDLSGAIPFMIHITGIINTDIDDDMNYIPRMEQNTEWQDKMSGGSWNMNSSQPSEEQRNAETITRNVLFKDLMTKPTTSGHDSDSDMFVSGGSCCMYPETYTEEQLQAEKEVHSVLFKDIETCNYNKYNIDSIYTALSNSPMFQNNDGFTAMNDHGLSIQTKIDSRNPGSTIDPNTFAAFGTEPAENFGIAAANDEAETTVDDFFPAPFIPFTM
jgi:hypothetical protein